MATTIFLLSLSVRDSSRAGSFLELSIVVGTSVFKAYLRLFFTKRNITSAIKARAMIALIIILAIAPLDSFFEEDGVNVFDINEEEVLISEMLSVITEAA